MKLHARVAEIPGARVIYESFFGSPGSWLYRRPTLDWLSDPSLARRLPWLYRCFAKYCAAQSQDPVCAEALLRCIIALYSRFSKSDHVIPLQIGTFTLFLDLTDPRFLQVPNELTGLTRVLPTFLKAGDTFIDVGANHGTFSIVASPLVGKEGLVIAIEPQPRLAGLLKRSLAEGPAEFEVHQLACGDVSKKIEFYLPSATSGSAGRFVRYSAISDHRTIEVAMRPIDDVIDWRRLRGKTLIKVDVEGSELAFLLGARQLIHASAPVLLMEMNPVAMSAAGTSKTKLVQTLLDFGYDRFVTQQELQRPRPLTDQTVEPDLILLPASFP